MKVVIVMPAYNAAKTVEKTYRAIPPEYRENVILIDDKSGDNTIKVARKLGISVFGHKQNKGYGGNQKTCYLHALKIGADIVVMLHPDYQYPPEFVAPMVKMIESGDYDVVLGSRMLCGEALRGGMPKYKYIANKILTIIENIFTGAHLSEYHTGYRAYKSTVLKNINFTNNSDNFDFDNQFLIQVIARNYKIGEISSPCRYFPEASSINFRRSVVYGLRCLWWSILYFMGRINIYKSAAIYP